MALIKGKQLGIGPNGIQRGNIKDGEVVAAAIGTAAIIAIKIATGAVETAALADASVSTAKIQDASISSAKIIDASITTAKLNDASVSTAKIIDGAISSAKFAVGAVDSTALGASSVIAAKIATGAVLTAAIAANAVTAAKVASDVIVTSGANQFASHQSMGTFRLTNLGNPSVGTDAANMSYVDARVDSIAVGLTDFKQSVRAVSVTSLAGAFASNNLVLSSNGALIVDGVTLVAGNRLILAGQSPSWQNGIYTVTTAGSAGSAAALLRATDADSSTEVTAGMYAYVSEGTSYANSAWVLSALDPIVLNTTALTIAQFSGTGQLTAGLGLTKTNNTFDVQVDGSSIEIDSDALRIAAGAAGAGLTGGGASALAVGAGAGIDVSANAIAVLYGAANDLSTGTAGASKAAGALDTAARTDHAHSFPTAAAVAVGAANAEGSSASFARADHVHVAPAASALNKNMAASVTSADGNAASATGLAVAPALAGYVQVLVNGMQYLVGNNTKTAVDCYFSADNGATAKAFSALAYLDKLHWNGSVAGFQLDATDVVDFNFMAF